MKKSLFASITLLLFLIPTIAFGAIDDGCTPVTHISQTNDQNDTIIAEWDNSETSTVWGTEDFDSPVNYLIVETLQVQLKRDPGTVCNGVEAELDNASWSTQNRSNEQFDLTDDYQTLTYTFTWSATDTASVEFSHVMLTPKTSYSNCTMISKMSDTQITGEHHGASAFGFSMYYYMAGEYIYPDECNQQTFTDDAKLYSLSVVYPQTTNYPYYDLNNSTASSTVFKFAYRLSSDDRREDRSFNVWASDYPDFSAVQLVQEGSIATLDPNSTGQLSAELPYNADTPKYFQAQIADINEQSIVYAENDFAINGSNSQLTNLSHKDLGFWGNMFRTVFVPDDTMLHQFSGVTDQLMSKAGFSYLAQAKDIMTSITVSETSTPSLNLKLKFPHSATSSLAILNIDNTTHFTGSGFIPLFRNIQIAGLWLFFVVYCYRRITGIFAPHQPSLF